ncbi:MAG TPA: periplasmic heavy metal sensor [Oxalicibacterium sp.]
MNKQITTNRTASHAASSPRSRMVLAGVTAALIGALSLSGISQAEETTASQSAPQATAQKHAGKHRMSPEQAEKRTQRMIERLVPDATPEQKTKLAAIAKARFDELRPLNKKLRAARADQMKLLSQPTIDRSALEKARQANQQLADQRSRIVTKSFADAAEVLTPAQRVAAAEKLAKHRHHFRHGHGSRHHDGKMHDGAAQ